MESTEETWVPCIVFGASGDLRFGCPLRTGFSVLIPPIHHVEIGDFVDIKYKENPSSTSSHRAQHIATNLRKSETPAPKIVVADKKIIFFYVTGQVRDFDKYNNKRVTLLYNELFGFLIDLDAKLPLLEKGTLVDLKCRFKESPLREKSTIFVVADYRNPRKPSSSSMVSSSIGPRNPHEVETVGEIPEVTLPTTSRDEWAMSPEKAVVTPSEEAASVVCDRKPMNKFASKSKTEMFYTIFNNEEMLSKVKALDKDLWAHIVNVATTGE